MPISKTDLKFYLTHIDPHQTQDDPSQSVGGYASDTEAFPETTTTAVIDRGDTSVPVVSGDAVLGHDYLLVGDELVKVASVSSSSVTVSARGVLGTESRTHLSGTAVRAMGFTALFGNDFNESLKQYRCIALKNTSTTQTAYSVSVYLRYPSRSEGSTVRMAVEVPSNDTHTGTVASGTTLSVTDNTISSTYADNALVGAVVTFTSGDLTGTSALVASYDKETKTMTFTEALASAPEASDAYLLSAGPCQRLMNGEIAPEIGTKVTSFSAATTPQTISIDGRVHLSSLRPGDVVYVWLERSLSRNAEAFDNNRAVLAVRYSKS